MSDTPENTPDAATWPTAVSGQYPILRYFHYEHLPERLQLVSEPFCHLAAAIAETLPRGPETAVALRKMLEAKDAAVRSALDADQ